MRRPSGAGCMILAAHGAIVLNHAPPEGSSVRLEAVARLVVSLATWATDDALMRLQFRRHRVVATQFRAHREAGFVVVVTPLDEDDEASGNLELQAMQIAASAGGAFRDASADALAEARRSSELTLAACTANTLSQNPPRFIDAAPDTVRVLEDLHRRCVQPVLRERSPVFSCLAEVRGLRGVSGEPRLVFRGDAPDGIAPDLVSLCADLLANSPRPDAEVCSDIVEVVWPREEPPASRVACALPLFGCCVLVPLEAPSPKESRQERRASNFVSRSPTEATRRVEAVWRRLRLPS